ncbi:MAG TPA: MFS transporter [Mycobacteriales bacterium]|nr:MFS transporter [Mycobacteriales bacterium]
MTDLISPPARRSSQLPTGRTRRRVADLLALPVLLAGTALIVVDFFIVNVALPSLQTDLHASTTAVEWVIAGYGLTFAALLVAAGRIGDRIGRRRVFTIGVGLFTAASAGCGLAPNPSTLVIARLAQGCGGAMISATVIALISVLYDGPARARAISVYATVMGVAAASGQLLGGLLLRSDLAGLGWRLIFLVNLPIGVAALIAAPRCLPESRADRAGRVDVVGLVMMTMGLTALVLPLIDGRSAGWPAWTIASLAAAPVLLVGFGLRQRGVVRRGLQPLLDPALLRSRSFTAGLLVQLGFWSGQASYFLVLALYLQTGRGLSALESGLVFSILAAAYLVASMAAPALQARFGRATVAAGAAALATGHLLAIGTTIGGAHPVLLLTPALLLAGAGMGLCIAPITTTVLSSLEPAQAGVVSGVLSTVQQVGNALGVAVVGLVFFGALRPGAAEAFRDSLVLLAGLLAVVAVAAGVLLPARAAAADAGG